MAALEIVMNLSALRAYDPPSTGSIPVNGDTVYVQCHSNYGDGGGGVFNFISAETKQDNDGTVVKSSLTATGRWVRQYEGYISVRFFGTIGTSKYDDGIRIQKAIDYAAGNIITNTYTKGNTVYIPSGDYRIHAPLVLKDGVSIIGDSISTTFLSAGYPDDGGIIPVGSSYGGYILTMATGRVTGCNISNIGFSGRVYAVGSFDPDVVDTKMKGCIHFEAKIGEYGDGGLWNSTFKNIKMRDFNGHGLYLDGSGIGDGEYMAPNQLLVFENVYINRQKSVSHALFMEGQQGQVTFINCGLGGITYAQNSGAFKVLKGKNAVIKNKGYIQTAVTSFINCTFQDAEYGIHIGFAESITFDTCWFETLDMALTAVTNGQPSKGINVVNSRFANASGFGSLNVINRNILPPGQTSGRCITAVGADINVYNNYVTVSDVNATSPNNPLESKVFILGLEQSSGVANFGIRTIGNSFQDNRLGYSGGILQSFPMLTSAGSRYVNLKDTKLAYIKGEAGNPAIERIECSVNAGEIISISTYDLAIKFSEAKNIMLSGKGTIIVNKGDMATFIKIDIPLNGYKEVYQLISLFKSTTPV